MIFQTYNDAEGNQKVGLWTTANKARDTENFKSNLDSISEIFAQYKDAGGDIGENFSKAFQKASESADSFGKKFKSAFDKNISKNGDFDSATSGLKKMRVELDATSKSAGKLSGIKDSVKNLGGTLKSLGQNLLSGLGNMGISMAISMAADFAINSLIDWITSKSRMAEEAAKSAQETESKLTNLDSYKSQVAQLKESLDSGNLSETEAYNVRSQLIGIQDELIATYGDEASALDMLGDSIENTNQKMEQLGKSDMKNWLASNSEAIKNANQYMNEKIDISTTTWYGQNFKLDEKARSDVQKIVEEYGGTFKHTDFDGDWIAMFDTTRANFEEQWSKMRTAILDYCQANGIDSSEILQYMTWTYDYVVDDNYKNNKEVYDQTGKYIVETQNQYSEFYDTIQKKQSKFQDAVASGNKDSIQQATQDISALSTEMQKMEDDNQFSGQYGQQAKNYLQNILDGMQKEANKQTLKIKFEDDDSLKKLFDNVTPTMANQFASDSLVVGALSEDQKEKFDAIKAAADESKVSVSDFISIAQSLGYGVDETTAKLQNISSEITQFASSVSELTSMQEKVNAVLSEQAESGSISIDTYKSLIDTIPMANTALESNGELIQVNRDRLNELAKSQAEATKSDLTNAIATQTQEWAQNTKEILDLQNAKGELTSEQQQELQSLLSINDAIADQITQYGLLMSQIDYATSGYKAWIDAQSGSDSGDMQSQAVNAAKYMKSVFEYSESTADVYGRINSKEFNAAAQFLIPQKVIDQGAQSIYKYYQGIEKYFTGTQSSVQAFWDDMVANELATFNQSTGEYKIKPKVDTSDIEEKLNLTDGVVVSLLGESKEYGIKVDFTDENVVEAINKIQELINAKQELNDLRKQQKTDGAFVDEDALDAAKQKVSDLSDEVLDLKKKLGKDGIKLPVEIDDKTGKIKVDEDKLEAVKVEVKYDPKTDLQQAMEKYRKAALELSKLDVENSDNNEKVKELTQTMDDCRDSMNKFSETEKNLRGVDTSLMDSNLGIASWSETLNEYDSALAKAREAKEAFNQAQAKGIEGDQLAQLSQDAAEADTQLRSVAESIANAAEKSNIDFKATFQVENKDELVDKLINGEISSEAVSLAISTNTGDAESKIASLEERKKALEEPVDLSISVQSDGVSTLEDISQKVSELTRDTKTVNVNVQMHGQDQVKSVQKLIQTEYPPISVRVDLSTEDAETKLTALGANYPPITIAINANTTPAMLAMSGLTSAIPPQTLVVTANTSSAVASISALMAMTIADKTVTVNVNDQASSHIAAINTAIQNLPDKTVNISASVSGLNDVQSLGDEINALSSKSITITTYRDTVYRTPVKPAVNGTAHAQGTVKIGGNAYTQGNWGAPRTEVALTGELGQELIVRGDRFFTVGDYGAEFVQIHKGDIVFNHKQTESLLKNGYVTGRGTAFAEGSAFVSGGGILWGGGNSAPSTNQKSSQKTASAAKRASKIAKNAANSMDKLLESYSRLFDWIEVKLDRVAKITEKKIENIDRYTNRDLNDVKNVSYKRTKAKQGAYIKTGNGYKYVGKNKGNYNKVTSVTKGILTIVEDAINAVKSEIKTNLSAASTYKAQATQIAKETKLDSGIVEKIQNGTIRISNYGEQTQKKIKEYQTWWNKYLDATETVDDLEDKLRELRMEKIDRIETYYNNRITNLENNSDLRQGKVDLLVTKRTEKGKLFSYADRKELNKAYWSEKASLEKKLELQNAEAKAMQKQRDALVKNGQMKKYDNDWYDLTDRIKSLQSAANDTKIAIQQLAESLTDVLLENVQTVYGNLVNLYESRGQNQQSKLDLLAARKTDEGLIYSRKDKKDINSYYSSMAKALKVQRTTLEEEEKALTKRLNSLVNSNGKNKIDVKSKDWYKLKDAIKEVQGQLYDVQLQEEELNNQKVEFMMSNIDTYYGNRTQQKDNVISYLESVIDRKIATGKVVTADDYNAILKKMVDGTSNGYSQMRYLEEQRVALQTEMQNLIDSGDLKMYSSDWYEWNGKILEINKNIEDLQISIEEMNQAVAQLKLDQIDAFLDRLEAIRNNLEGMMDLHEAQGYDAVADDYLQLISGADQQITGYKNKLAELKEQQSGYEYDSEKWRELQEEIASANDAILQLKISQEKWNDSIIDVQIDAIKKQKDEYEKLNKQTDNQLKLEKALEAVEKARTQRNKLVYREGLGFVYEADQEALKDAQDNLNDIYYDDVLDKFDEAIDKLEELKKGNNLYDYDANRTAGNSVDLAVQEISYQIQDILEAERAKKESAVSAAYLPIANGGLADEIHPELLTQGRYRWLDKESSLYPTQLTDSMRDSFTQNIKNFSVQAQKLPASNLNVTNNQSENIQMYFNGDLSFPNITQANEAGKLTEELQLLALKAEQRTQRR